MCQNLPVKEGVILDGKRYKDVYRIRNGYMTEVITNVDNDEIVKMGGEICRTFEGVKYRENFEMSPFKKVRE